VIHVQNITDIAVKWFPLLHILEVPHSNLDLVMAVMTGFLSLEADAKIMPQNKI
jgi:hypothetical protein